MRSNERKTVVKGQEPKRSFTTNLGKWHVMSPHTPRPREELSPYRPRVVFGVKGESVPTW